jgi:hypothetical protein
MPENETLTPNTPNASRWQPLRDRLAGGESPDAIFPDLQDQFYRALKHVFEQWKDRGVDPQQLFEAALNKPAMLRDLVSRMRNDEFAKLLQDGIAGESNQNLEGVIRSFLYGVWEDVRGLLQLDCREDGVPVTFFNSVDQMLERLIRSLLKDPSRIPRRPSKNKPPLDIDDLLGESLPLA